jgi:two-component system KDP operon response regulator KdpE
MGEEYPGSVEAIRVYVQRLRKKVEEVSTKSDLIETKSHLGYLFNIIE